MLYSVGQTVHMTVAHNFTARVVQDTDGLRVEIAWNIGKRTYAHYATVASLEDAYAIIRRYERREENNDEL